MLYTSEYLGNVPGIDPSLTMPEVMPDFEVTQLLAANSTETKAMQLYLVPGSDEQPVALDDLYSNYVELCDLHHAKPARHNFDELVRRAPVGIYEEFTERSSGNEYARRSPYGDVAAALGGHLLKIGYDYNFKLRDFLQQPNRNSNLNGSVDEPPISPQHNRLALLAILRSGERPLIVPEILEADPNGTFRQRYLTNWGRELQSLDIVDILPPAPSAPRFNRWELTEKGIEIVDSLFIVLSRFAVREAGVVTEGFEHLDRLLGPDASRSIASQMHKRTALTNQSPTVFERFNSLNEQLRSLSPEDGDEVMTTQQVAELLGDHTINAKFLRKLIKYIGAASVLQPLETDGRRSKELHWRFRSQRIAPIA